MDTPLQEFIPSYCFESISHNSDTPGILDRLGWFLTPYDHQPRGVNCGQPHPWKKPTGCCSHGAQHTGALISGADAAGQTQPFWRGKSRAVKIRKKKRSETHHQKQEPPRTVGFMRGLSILNGEYKSTYNSELQC